MKKIVLTTIDRTTGLAESDVTYVPENLADAEHIAKVESEYNCRNYPANGKSKDELKQHIYQRKLAEGIVCMKLLKRGLSFYKGIEMLRSGPDSMTDLVATDGTCTYDFQVNSFSTCPKYLDIGMSRYAELTSYKGTIVWHLFKADKTYMIQGEKLKSILSESKFTDCNGEFGHFTTWDRLEELA